MIASIGMVFMHNLWQVQRPDNTRYASVHRNTSRCRFQKAAKSWVQRGSRQFCGILANLQPSRFSRILTGRGNICPTSGAHYQLPRDLGLLHDDSQDHLVSSMMIVKITWSPP